MTSIKGPAAGYRITPQAQDQGTALRNPEVHASSSRAGDALPPTVEKALQHALADRHLSVEEFEGGQVARLLRGLGLDVGSSVLGSMRDDGLLQKHQIDPVDYRACLRLRERAALPVDHPEHIALEDGVAERLGRVIEAFEARLQQGPQVGAFIEEIQDPALGAQKVVNQTAMVWAPVDTERFLERLPPERWAEECYDLKSLHNQLLERQELPDGGYQITLLQRMEFGEGGTATDMTKRTVVRKWKDPGSGQWHATAEWKVYSSDPTDQIPHAGSMRIDTGRMEFKPVQREGRWVTEVLFNNATQTNTATEEKLLGLVGKNTPLRQAISAKLGASPLGILPFASAVVERYRDVGSGRIPPRWPALAAHTTAATGSARSVDPPHAGSARARIETLLTGPTERAQEAELLGLLRAASGPELDQLVQQLDLRRLVEAMDDRWLGPDNRDALLDLLTQERVDALSTPSRARLISALQHSETPHAFEHAIEHLFVATHGAELTALKNAIDAGGDHRDLVQLLHADIDSGFVRRRILRHIAKEAPARQPGRVKVLSDIDDTFYANLKDARFPSKTVYPGVRSFYEALTGARGPGAEARVGFLTARPEDPTGLVEDETLRMLRERGVGEAMALGGDLAHVVGNAEIAEKKRENFETFAALYPEYGFVFIGDSGQGDALLAQGLAADHAAQVPASFIHDVVGLPEAQRQSLAEQGVLVFDTYAGAALAAHRKGLIGLDALARVARDSVAELKAVPFGDPAQRAARRAELGRDLQAINALLPADQRVEL